MHSNLTSWRDIARRIVFLMAGARATALSCFSLLLFCSYALVSPGSSDATVVDELALLSFKSMLSGPSDGLLASWNTSIHYCDWTGVVCSGRRQPERVVALLMNSSAFRAASRRSWVTCPFSTGWTFTATDLLGRYHRSSAISAGFGC